MKLSTRTRYGTRALLELALHREGGLVSLKDVAGKQNISLSYLEHLVTPLISGGIIRSVKGPKGGIALVKKPADIKMIDVTRLLEGSLAPVECVDHPEVCDRSGKCVTRDVWSEVKTAMDKVLENTTLADLAARQQKKDKQPA
ncbi:MAG: Rrf2 family transcriptional regulator [Dehalococcoidales bacterium]|jgi:Rrf2 family protein